MYKSSNSIKKIETSITSRFATPKELQEYKTLLKKTKTDTFSLWWLKNSETDDVIANGITLFKQNKETKKCSARLKYKHIKRTNKLLNDGEECDSDDEHADTIAELLDKCP